MTNFHRATSISHDRRMFRSQTSDNMDRYKAEKKVREEKRIKKKIKQEKFRESKKKEVQVREKVGKWRNVVFFQ